MRKLRRVKSLAFSATLVLVSALLVPLFSPPALAQATTGSIRGVVTDSNGAVIPDADVTATEVATSVETKTKSNGEGLYTLPKLKPGIYTLTVQRANYKKQEFQQVVVSLGQDVTLDTVLQAGLATETVTVTAGGEEYIQKEQVQISSTFDTRKVADLPSNSAGGGMDTLALLAPGVVPGFGNVNSNGTTISVNGQRARSNNFTIDGGDNNDLTLGGPSFFVDNQDTVAEFQVITNNFSAEYGRNQGAIVNIVTKSGTNQFHGTAFEFYRSANYLDSLNNIEKRAGDLSGPPADVVNVFGGTVGGPVLKDRLFFFGSYQRTLDHQAFLAQSTTPAIVASDLPRLLALNPNNAALQTYANFSAFALTDFGVLSERTDFPQDATVTIGGQTFRTAYPQRLFPVNFEQHEFSARGDYKITDKHSVWYRQFYQKSTNLNALGGSNGFTGDIPASGNLASANFTSQISNSAVNEFRFVYNKLSVIFGGCSGFKGCVTTPDTIGDNLANISFTGLRNTAGDSLQTIGTATNLPQGRVVTVYQFADNFSITKGLHELKMGVDYRHLINSVPFLPTVNGAFRFSSATRLLNNAPAFTNLAVGQVTIDYKENDQFYYLQDNWRIRDNLTLNLGIRYEYTGQPVNTIHDITLERESNPATAIWKQSLPLDVRTYPKTDADKNNWAPRLGFAWRPSFGDSKIGKILFGEQDKSVISGGYSIAYDPGFYNIMLNVSTASPTVFLNTVNGPASGTIPFPLPPNPTGTNVQAFAESKGLIALNTFDPRFFNYTNVPPGFRSPYAQQWSLRWQREFSRNNVVEVRYVGTHGVGLFQTVNGNPRIDRIINGFSAGGFTFKGFPDLVPAGVKPLTCVDNPATPDNESTCNGRVLPQSLIRTRSNAAQSMYHGLQTRYQGRLFNQVSLGASYTFSKAIDDASEIFSFFETAYPQDPYSFKSERGLSGFDRRHAGSLNFVWDLPLYKDQKGLLGNMLGGWSLNGTYFLAAGQRYTAREFCNSLCVGVGYEDTTFAATFFGADALRPFWGNPNAPRGSVGINQVDAALIFGSDVTDPNGFYSMNELNATGNAVTVSKDKVRYIYNGPGAAQVFNSPFGNVPRGSETGPLLNNLNLGVFKNFRITERTRIQLRLETFNTLNHPNPGVGFITTNSAGAPDNFVEDAGSPDGYGDFGGIQFARRSVQLGLKIIF